MATTPGLLAGTQRTLEIGGVGQDYWAFPTITRCANGDLLAVYYGAAGHVGPAGNLYSRRSTDQGATWNGRVTVLDDTTDFRDPGLALLSDDRVMLSYTETDNSSFVGNGTFYTAHVMASDDHGATWDTPVAVDPGAGLDWSFTTAPVVELVNGDLLLPYYGSDTLNGGDDVVRVAASTDGGATWADLATVASEAAHDLDEPVLLLLDDQETLACFIRNSTDNQIEVSLSTDDGATWGSRPTVTAGNGRPAAGLTSDGLVLLQFRDAGTNAFHYLALDADADPASAGSEVNLASGSGAVMIYGGWTQRTDGVVVSVFAIENDANVYYQAIDTEAGALKVPPGAEPSTPDYELAACRPAAAVIL